MHGGKTPVASGLPQTRHGRYSSYLPARLSGKYEQSKSDPDLLALREEVSIVDSRIAELLERIDTGESKTQWELLRSAHGQLQQAVQNRDTAKMAALIKRMGELIQTGAEDSAAWADIFEAVEQRRRLVESERKYMIEQQQTITYDRAMLLISALVDIIRRHVSDTNTMAAIDADVGKLITIEGA